MIDKPLYQNPLGGGFETSFGLLDSNPDREKQYFYNKDLNKLFNMPMGVRMAAPKGFESVNKDQYEDYANKGATLQGANMFNDSMGGGYNLDLPRDQFGSIDRTSSEYDYFYGDNQQKPNIGAGILGTYMPSQEEGLEHLASNIPLNNFPGNPNRKPADPANLGSAKPGVNPIVSGNESEIASINGPGLLEGPPVFRTPGLPPQEEYDPDKYAEFLQKATVQGPEDTLMGIEKLQRQNQNPYQNNNANMSNFKNMENLLQNIDGGIQSLIDNSSYMQNNNNLSQFPFSNSSSPNFMGGDILKWSSYK